MSVVSTYKEIVSNITEAFFGFEIKGFRIEREEWHAPDLVYTLQTPSNWNARAKYYPITDKPEEIVYSLSNLYQSYVPSELHDGDEVDAFLTYYEIVELEEVTHCMGEVDVKPGHSMRWMQFLVENVVSHTSDADYVEIRFE